jgi:hypothetical protein
MSDDKIFADGLIAKKPHERAPDFVKANLSFKMKEFVEWGRTHHVDGWINIQVKESKGGKWYAEKDTFTPSKKEEYDTGATAAKAAMDPAIQDDDIPF